MKKPKSAAKQKGTKKAKGLSLHIGLNSVDPKHYGGWSGPLQACEADAEDMFAIAKSRRFQPTALMTDQATREAVISRIQWAASKMSRGDIFFVSYSGHGGQVPDVNGDETDLQDETWCLYDGQLIDDELQALWAKFAAGVRILVLSDSCHSGTVTKMAFDPFASGSPRVGALAAVYDVAGASYRFMPDAIALRTYRKNRAFYKKVAASAPKTPPSVKATVRLLSGCQDNQLSMDGTFNGLFTGTLLQVWGNGTFKGNYASFHRAIVDRMPSTQSPNHYIHGPSDPAYDKQKPFSI